MKRTLSVPIAAMIGATLLTACGGGGGDDTKRDYAVDADTSLLLSYDASNYHPLTSAGSTYEVALFTSDRLFWVDPSTNDPQPWIASEWEESANRVDFTIRSGVTCSNGEPFTAETVARNFEFVLDPANASPWYNSFVPADAKVSTSGDVVTVETPSPAAFLAGNLANVPLVCDDALDDPQGFQTISSGTGLYVLKDYVAGDKLTLERRDDYAWAPDGTTGETAGVPQTVTFRIVEDPSTAANLVQSGELNSAIIGGADEVRLMDGGLEYVENQHPPETIYFNQVEGSPTSDPAARTALTQAVNLDELMDVMLAGQGTRAESTMTTLPRPCTYDSVSGNLPEHDADAAVATLEAGGWKPGADGILEKDGLPLHIDLFYLNTSDSMSAAAEILAEEWKAVGASVTLTGGDRTWLTAATWGAEDLTSWTATLGLTLTVDTPAQMVPILNGPPPPAGINFASISNDGYATKVAEAMETVGDEGCDLWREAEASLIEDLAFVPVASGPARRFFNGAETTVESGRLHGFQLRALQ